MPRIARSSLEQLLVTRRNQLLQDSMLRRQADYDLAERADWIDLAQHAQETEITAHLRQNQFRLLRAIEEALQRIRKGTFGVCTNCGKRIGRARLRAVPWTRLCLGCKQQSD